MYDEFEARNIVVIAIAQEDKDLESHGRFYKHFDPAPRFVIAADFDRKNTTSYERTSTYLIDTKGIVRQVFPQMIHYRADWRAILNEADRLLNSQR